MCRTTSFHICSSNPTVLAWSWHMYDKRLTPCGYRMNLMKWLGSNHPLCLVKVPLDGGSRAEEKVKFTREKEGLHLWVVGGKKVMWERRATPDKRMTSLCPPQTRRKKLQLQLGKCKTGRSSSLAPLSLAHLIHVLGSCWLPPSNFPILLAHISIWGVCDCEKANSTFSKVYGLWYRISTSAYHLPDHTSWSRVDLRLSWFNHGESLGFC